MEALTTERRFNVDQQRNRQRLSHHLSRNPHSDIYIALTGAVGMDMMNAWVHQTTLERFCAEFNIPPSRFSLHALAPGELVPRGGINLSQVEEDYALRRPSLQHSVQHEYQVLYGQAASPLGVSITRWDLARNPQPLPIRGTAFENYNRGEVIIRAQRLRRVIEREGLTSIVILQFGDNMAKRLTDEQIGEIARELRRGRPDLHITVITDKKFIKRRVVSQTDEDREALREQYPVEDPAFVRQLDRQQSSEYGRSVDQVVSDGINIMGASILASDFCITTDSFGAWLAAGMRVLGADRAGVLSPQDLAVLYTIYDSKVWGIPHATIVESPMLAQAKQFTLLPRHGLLPEHLYLSWRLGTDRAVKQVAEHEAYKIPISRFDIHALIEASRRIISRPRKIA